MKDNYFLDCFQTSTTNSNSNYQGGSRDVWYVNNLFENMGGSVKFANRVLSLAHDHTIWFVYTSNGTPADQQCAVINLGPRNLPFDGCMNVCNQVFCELACFPEAVQLIEAQPLDRIDCGQPFSHLGANVLKGLVERQIHTPWVLKIRVQHMLDPLTLGPLPSQWQGRAHHPLKQGFK